MIYLLKMLLPMAAIAIGMMPAAKADIGSDNPNGASGSTHSPPRSLGKTGPSSQWPTVSAADDRSRSRIESTPIPGAADEEKIKSGDSDFAGGEETSNSQQEATSGNKPQRLQPWIPPGFESLMAPQQALVDVYHAESFVVRTMAEFTPESIRLLHPIEVTNALENLADIVWANRALASPMPTNTSRLCASRNQVDCGALATESIGIVFDMQKLKADLFIGPDHLKVEALEDFSYLPPPENSLALLNRVTVNYNGVASESMNYSVRNETIVGKGSVNLRALSEIGKDQSLEFDELVLQRDSKGHNMEFGLLRNTRRAFSFIDNDGYLGFNVSRSQDTVRINDAAYANPVMIFLPSRSLVEIYRDGRLLASDYYGPGNVAIDTAGLPGGSYDIELRITDDAGNTRTELQYYSKIRQLPPYGQPGYFLQAGRKTSRGGDLLPDVDGVNFARAGYARRLTESIGAGAALSVDDFSTMAEFSTFIQRPLWMSELGFAMESDGQTASDLDFRIGRDGIRLDLSARKVWNPDVDAIERINFDRPDYGQLGRTSGQYTVALQFPIGSGNLNFFGRYNEAEFSNHSYGMRFNWRRNFLSGENISTDLEVSDNDGQFFASIRFSFSLSAGRSYHTVSPGFEFNEALDGSDRSDFRGRAGTRWRNDGLDGAQYELGLNLISETSDELESTFDADTRWGAADVSARYLIDEQDTRVRGRISTNFALSDGTFAFGGHSRGESAILARVETADGEPAEFDINTSEGAPRRVRSGHWYLLPKKSFRTYDISISSRAHDLLRFEQRPLTRTLYPGNVVAVTWQAERVLVIAGQVLDADGQPMERATFTNVVGLASTDENGFFQAEIFGSAERLMLKQGDAGCSIPLPDFSEPQDQFHYLGKLECGPSIKPDGLRAHREQ